MKIAANIVGVLLGLLFLMASVTYFLLIFGLMHMDMPPQGPLAENFMKAVGPSGFLTYVKCFEFLGAILVMIPRLRNFGLLILGPILINIVAFHVFIAKGGLFEPMLIAIIVFEAFLLWVGRRAFLGLAQS